MTPTQPSMASPESNRSASVALGPAGGGAGLLPTLPARPNRLAELDVLRGLAAMLVIWIHVSEVYIHLPPGSEGRRSWVLDVAVMGNLGYAGVLLFFLISGFVICHSLTGTRAQGSRKFLIRRFFRLYPAFWLSIPLGLVTMQWLFGRWPGTGAILANVTMLPTMLFHQPPVIGLYWTLEYELVFYGLCLVLFLLRWHNRPLPLFMVSLGFIGLRTLMRDTALPFCLHLMFAAAVFRCWFDDPQGVVTVGRLRIPLRWMTAGLFLVVILPRVMQLARLPWLADATLADFKFRSNFPVLLAVALFLGGMTLWRCRVRFLAWLGAISYSIYLFHPVVFYTLYWWLKNHGPERWRYAPLGVYVLVNIALTIPVAAAIYYGLEKPAMALGKHLSRDRRLAGVSRSSSTQPGPI